MPDKAGDRFTDKIGKTYELRPDPQDGHLRPVTVKGAHNNWLAAILAAIMIPVIVKGLRWIWSKITKREKIEK